MILSSYTRIKALIYAYVINKGAGVRTPPLDRLQTFREHNL